MKGVSNCAVILRIILIFKKCNVRNSSKCFRIRYENVFTCFLIILIESTFYEKCFKIISNLVAMLIYQIVVSGMRKIHE